MVGKVDKRSTRNKSSDLKKIQKELEVKFKGKVKKGAPEFPYSTKLADEICQTIAISPYGLERICREHDHFPKARTIYKWVIQKADFSQKYNEAKAMQTDAYVNEIMERSYNEDGDSWVDEHGNSRPNTVKIARDRLISDNVKWYASKLRRKKWGDVSTVETRDITHEEGLEDLDKK